eukprot:TRINITY_DN6213_c0_g1_i2.p1 TRINITY_DN6213_c0_g1~~TRINITY_DN6213_c0_g1_i2.p1  ORF type:complete len:166 (+),score=25.04 TRINITY_DN6213_c0_g1_i2:3-500(+)
MNQQENTLDILKAAQIGSLDGVKECISQNQNWLVTDSYKRNAFHWACYKKHVEIVNFLLGYATKSDLSTILDLKDIKGKTALQFAVQTGDLEIVDVLLRHGATVDSVNIAGQTALHYASFNADLNMIKLLCSYGANVKTANQEGQTGFVFLFIFWKILSCTFDFA